MSTLVFSLDCTLTDALIRVVELLGFLLQESSPNDFLGCQLANFVGGTNVRMIQFKNDGARASRRKLPLSLGQLCRPV